MDKIYIGKRKYDRVTPLANDKKGTMKSRGVTEILEVVPNIINTIELFEVVNVSGAKNYGSTFKSKLIFSNGSTMDYYLTTEKFFAYLVSGFFIPKTDGEKITIDANMMFMEIKGSSVLELVPFTQGVVATENALNKDKKEMEEITNVNKTHSIEKGDYIIQGEYLHIYLPKMYGTNLNEYKKELLIKPTSHNRTLILKERVNGEKLSNKYSVLSDTDVEKEIFTIFDKEYILEKFEKVSPTDMKKLALYKEKGEILSMSDEDLSKVNEYMNQFDFDFFLKAINYKTTSQFVYDSYQIKKPINRIKASVDLIFVKNNKKEFDNLDLFSEDKLQLLGILALYYTGSLRASSRETYYPIEKKKIGDLPFAKVYYTGK